MRALCLSLVLSVSVAPPGWSEWLRSDAKVVAQSGYLFGLAAYCGLAEGTALLAETMAYTDIHKTQREDVRTAGELFRRGSELGEQDMDDPDRRMPCGEVETLLERRVKDLHDANAAGRKIEP